MEWRSENGYDLWEDHSTASQLILEAPTLPGHWGDRILLRVRVDAGVPVGTQLTNTVEIATAGDSDPNNNREVRNDVWIKPPRWDSMVDKRFGAGPMVPGGEIYYNLHIRNNGNMATHTVLTDTLPLGVSLSQAEDCSGPILRALPARQPGRPGGRLGPGRHGTGGVGPVEASARTSAARVQPGAVLTNCAELAIDGHDSRPIDNADCVADRVNTAGPNFRIDK